jgi:hypothetical protein
MRSMASALGLLVLLGNAAPVFSDTGDLSSVIELFVAKQFPQAANHFWVVNGAQHQTDTELVVDVNTITRNQGDQTPSENRFLLLIVSGKLAGAQNIPLSGEPECQPEQQA